MRLVRTTAAHQLVDAYVKDSSPDPFIVNCLAQHLAVVFYAEVEERIAEIIEGKLKKFTNTTVGRFLTSNMEKIIRRTRKSDIAGLLSNFDTAMQDNFNAAVPVNTVTIYTNVITARHSAGHKQGSNITLQELADGIIAAEKILDELDNCFV